MFSNLLQANAVQLAERKAKAAVRKLRSNKKYRLRHPIARITFFVSRVFCGKTCAIARR